MKIRLSIAIALFILLVAEAFGVCRKVLAQQQGRQQERTRVLVYAQGVPAEVHDQSIKIIEALKENPSIEAVLSSDSGDLTIQNLRANFDSVLLYQHNYGGRASFIPHQAIQDLITFSEEGHMLVAVHHAIFDPYRNNPDPDYNIIPLTDYIGGYLFDTSTSTGPAAIDGIEDNVLHVVDPANYLADGVSDFTLKNKEVYYALVRSKDITPVIVNQKYGPFVWSRGKYAVYMQMGHFTNEFDDPYVKRILQNAVLHLSHHHK